MELGLHILVFVISALFIGALARFLLAKTGIPYTVSLLVIGLLLGWLGNKADSMPEALLFISSTTNQVAQIEPHLILFLFLPALLFESAFTTEAHLFRRMLPQIALLAIPGLIIAIVLSALTVQYVLPLQWSWPIALMFGALISATDPVAVVALLKEKSSRKRLEILLEGESLLNDGTAIVFFTVFYAMAIGTISEPSVVDVSIGFLRVIAAGYLVGLIFAWLILFWVSKVFNDEMLETMVTVAGTYLVFLIAEHVFHASGVVAVVTMGIVFAYEGRTRFSPEVVNFLHHFWQMLANIFNTLIFLLVGIIIAKQVIWPSAQMWGALLILYVAAQVIRAVSIILLFPLMKRIGAGFNKEKAIVLTWGGLRGAVALAMALTVAQQETIDETVRHQILFFTAGMVVLSIVFNGGTISAVLRWLKLDKLPPAKEAAMVKAESAVDKTLINLSQTLESDRFLAKADWKLIKHRLGLLHFKQIEKNIHTLEHSELEIFYFRQMLETERQYYWNQFRQGLLGQHAAEILVQSVERALDGKPTIAPRQRLIDLWQGYGWQRYLNKVPIINKLVQQVTFETLLISYGTLRGFIQAQEMLKQEAIELAPDEDAFKDADMAINENLIVAYEIFNNFHKTYGDAVKHLETQSALRLLLNKQREVLSELKQAGTVEEAECNKLIKRVEEHMYELQKGGDIH